MFMRFRGGGVGHLGTRYLDSRLKEDNRELGDEQQDEVVFAGLYEDSNFYPHEEQTDGIEEDSGIHEEHTSRRELSNAEDEEVKDKDEDEDEDTDEDGEQEVSGNVSDKHDLDGEDGEVMNDDEILDEEEFAEL
jgi:hypothetical protein